MHVIAEQMLLSDLITQLLASAYAHWTAHFQCIACSMARILLLQHGTNPVVATGHRASRTGQGSCSGLDCSSSRGQHRAHLGWRVQRGDRQAPPQEGVQRWVCAGVTGHVPQVLQAFPGRRAQAPRPPGCWVLRSACIQVGFASLFGLYSLLVQHKYSLLLLQVLACMHACFVLRHGHQTCSNHFMPIGQQTV